MGVSFGSTLAVPRLTSCTLDLNCTGGSIPPAGVGLPSGGVSLPTLPAGLWDILDATSASTWRTFLARPPIMRSFPHALLGRVAVDKTPPPRKAATWADKHYADATCLCLLHTTSPHPSLVAPHPLCILGLPGLDTPAAHHHPYHNIHHTCLHLGIATCYTVFCSSFPTFGFKQPTSWPCWAPLVWEDLPRLAHHPHPPTQPQPPHHTHHTFHFPWDRRDFFTF